MSKKVIRMVDFARRLTLPRDLTEKLNLSPNESVELMFSEKNRCIVIKKHEHRYKQNK